MSIKKEMGKKVTEETLVNKDQPQTSASTSQDQLKSIQSRLLKLSNLTKISTKDKTVFLPSALMKGVKFNDQAAENVFNWYLTEILESKETDREDRYKEYLFMDKNSSEISSALDIYADESVQLGKVSTGIIADSQIPELKAEINKTLSRLRLNNINYLRDVSRGLAQFGDKPMAIEISDKGVESIEPVDIFNFRRLEKKIRVNPDGQMSFFDTNNKYQNVMNQTFDKSFYDMENKEESFKISDFKPFLLGFKLHDKIVPPWNCVHFRLYSSSSDFYPYGRSLIETVRPTYRHLLSLEILQALIKSTKFNKVNFNLDIKQSYDNPFDMFNKLNELRQAYNDHIVGESTRQRNPSFSTDIWTVSTNDAALTVKTIESAVKTSGDEVKDVEYMQNKLYMGLRLPKSYLLNDKTDNNDGSALIQQDIKFARLIYMIQSAILSGVVRILQIHLTVIGKEEWINKFSLSLPYPVPSYNLIELEAQSKRIKAVEDLGKVLTQTFGIEKLPLKTIRRMLVDMAHMPEVFIDGVIKDLEMENKPSDATSTPTEPSALAEPAAEPVKMGGGDATTKEQKWNEMRKKLDEAIGNEIIKENIDEWESGGRHHVNSKAYSLQDDIILGDLEKGKKYEALTEMIESESEESKEIVSSKTELTESAFVGGKDGK